MGFYVYQGNKPLDPDSLGFDGQFVRFWPDLESTYGAVHRARSIFKGQPFMVYMFTSFWGIKKYQLVHTGV